MAIPSLSSLEAKAAKKSGRAKKGPRLYLRYDPDTGEKVRVERDDDRYDEYLTAAQWRRQEAKAEKDDPDAEGFGKSIAKDVVKDVLKDLKRPTRGNRRAKRNIAKAAAEVAKTTGSAGKSVLTKVAPLAIRLAGVAAVVGAAWFLTKEWWGRSVRKQVEAEVARGEAMLKRPYTNAELEKLLPQYKEWFARSHPSQLKNNAAGGK